MLPEIVVLLVRSALGESALVDARRGRALISGVDGTELHTMLRRLSNYGFTQFVDFTGTHLGGEEYSLQLTIRAPQHGHAGVTLKWNWPPQVPVERNTAPANGGESQVEPPAPPEQDELTETVDPDLAGLGVAVHQIGPATDEDKTPADAATTEPDPGYNETGGAGQSGGHPRQTGPVAHPSLANIWPGAGLCERELLEMLGLSFTGNPNLSPLLIDAQFPGNPLRKDFTPPSREDYAAQLLKERETGAVTEILKAANRMEVSPDD